jgi:tetratricopeptide (TPR) repeat protein
MGALLVLYLVLVGLRAIAFLGTGQPLGIGIGIALLLLPVLGAWALVRELLFGLRSGRLVRALAAEEPLPGDDLPRRPSGRVERAAADEAFEGYAHAVEHDPDDWRAWLRLGLAYDASGDRRRARAAVRQAIALART